MTLPPVDLPEAVPSSTTSLQQVPFTKTTPVKRTSVLYVTSSTDIVINSDTSNSINSPTTLTVETSTPPSYPSNSNPPPSTKATGTPTADPSSSPFKQPFLLKSPSQKDRISTLQSEEFKSFNNESTSGKFSFVIPIQNDNQNQHQQGHVNSVAKKETINKKDSVDYDKNFDAKSDGNAGEDDNAVKIDTDVVISDALGGSAISDVSNTSDIVTGTSVLGVGGDAGLCGLEGKEGEGEGAKEVEGAHDEYEDDGYDEEGFDVSEDKADSHTHRDAGGGGGVGGTYDVYHT